jgi:hypothetical protein
VNVYPFIEAENVSTTGNVTRSCELLKISRAAYYAHRTATSSARERDDAELTAEIVAIHDESNGTYGTPRIHAELCARGRRHSRKRVARLLRAAGLAGQTPKRWRTTTVPDPAASTPADLIERDFPCRATDINTRWCGDITYIHTWEGWLYLATVIDLDSRRVVGWATADHLRTDLISAALGNAVAQRRPEPGVIFHSDRGCQGGFNWSSQHPDRGGVDGQASGVDESADGQVGDEVAGSTVASTGCGAVVLARDRQRAHQRGCRERGRRVAGGRQPVVPGAWRHADVHDRFVVRPVSVL